MKTGEFIYAKTHADFLNQAFGTNYKAWMKAVWPYYDENTVVWMVRFNAKDGGFTNTFLSDTRIEEKLLDPNMQVSPSNLYLNKDRIVIQIIDIDLDHTRTRKYIFKGVYKYDKTNSTPPLVRYHDKISDEI